MTMLPNQSFDMRSGVQLLLSQRKADEQLVANDPH
jgi:hypothetical protein